MKKNRREKRIRFTKYILPVAAVFSFAVCILEGFLYYQSSESSIYIRILMNIHNTFKTFLFSPIISISDARKSVEGPETTAFRLIVCYLYTTIVILAPICTATTLLRTIEKAIRNHINLFSHKLHNKIFVFGYNRESKEFLTNLADGDKWVILVAQKEPDENHKLELLKKGVAVLRGDYSNGDAEEIYAGLHKMKLEKADSIVLFDESPAANFSVFLHLVEYYERRSKERGIFDRILRRRYATRYIKCSISCDDYGMQEIITDYYNRYIEEVNHSDHNKLHIDLKLFSVPEISAQEIFKQKPIYYANLKDERVYHKRHYEWEVSTADMKNPWDTHIVIAGFGKLGQNILLQALNLGNLQSNSTITIDVFDKNVDEKKGIFAKRFCRDNVNIDTDSISYPEHKEHGDGKVIIHFHKVDIRTIDFEDALNKLKNVTYVAICFEDSSLCTLSMVTLEKYFKDIPIAVRMDVDKKVIEYIKNNDGSYKEVFPCGTGKEILTEKTIIGCDTDLQAIRYNSNYNEFSEMKKEPEISRSRELTRIELSNWNKMGYLKRYSSRKSAEHQMTKLILLLVDTWIKEGVAAELISHKINRLLESAAKQGKYEDTNIEQIKTQLEDIYDGILADKAIGELLGDKEMNELSSLEHRRYCSFMYTNGYRYEDKVKNDTLKTNPCLLSWERLWTKKPEMLIYDLLAIIICLEKMNKDKIDFDL